MADHKQINFTIVPDDAPGPDRQYANFCAVAHTPFDFTLTFCEVAPLSEKEIRDAEQEHLVKAPVRAKIVLPVQFIGPLIAALQENILLQLNPLPDITVPKKEYLLLAPRPANDFNVVFRCKGSQPSRQAECLEDIGIVADQVFPGLSHSSHDIDFVT